ncbi:MAG: T9SS type A sorting domain-containing protein [Bacteroidetes bacterium]|nr:T9SS type A sorting domain-containing protein [Bacteroidota bacterium]
MKKNYSLSFLRIIFFVFLANCTFFSNQSFGQLSGTKTIGTNGTEDYTSFTEAITALTTDGISGSVVFNVSSGTYNEQITIPEITGASASDTIVFQSATGDTADVKLYFEPTGTADNFTVKFDGADFIRFRNLTITSEGATDYGNVVKMINDIKHVHFHGNQFIGKSSTSGTFRDKHLIISETDSYDTSLVFDHNTFHSGNGIFLMERQTGLEFTNNVVYDATSAADIMIDYSNDCVMENNNIKGEVLFSQLNGTKANHDIKNNVIEGELKFENLAITAGQEVKVINNFIHGNIAVNTSSLIDIFNNTIVSESGYSIHVFTGCTDISILNNLIKTKSINACIELDDISVVDYLDYNNLFTTSTNIGRVNDVNYTTLADWQTATGLEEHSVNESVAFVDEANNDFHVAEGETDVFGAYLNEVKFDIDGEKKNETNPNIGADEYTKYPMSGTYTIGKNGTEDYESFTDAIDALIYNGITDDVLFDVSSGTYDEQFIIPEIDGANINDYISFMPATRNLGDVIITCTSSSEMDNYIAKLEKADFIYLYKLDFQVGNPTYGRILCLQDTATNNVIEQCSFTGNEVEYTSTYQALIYSPYGSHSDSLNIITANTFINGSYGVMFDGNGESIYEKGNDFRNNTFSEQYEFAYKLNNQDSCTIARDSIYNSTTCTSPSGIYLYDCKNEIIQSNIIYRYSNDGNGGYGIYLNECPGGISEYGMIYNNFVYIYTTTSAINTIGILLKNSSNRNLYYNSVNISGSFTSSQTFKVWGSEWYEAKNNIFSNKAGGWAMYSDVGSNFSSDYNNFYTTGTTLIGGTADAANLSEWQTNSSKDANSLCVDPQFISETNMHIYHANSDLNGAGTPITLVNRDIDFELRDGSNPDIGADEYDYMNDVNDFITYSFTEQTGDAEIDANNHTISVEVEYGTVLTALVATFTISESATVAIESTAQVSGVTVNDFSSPVTYTITAQDGTTQDWIITVTEAPSDENDILSFSFAEQTGIANISTVDHSVEIEVEFGTDLTSLIATFTLSDGATARIDAVHQVSGTTTNDFSSMVTYTVYAENGDTQDWTVTVTEALNSANDILTFSFSEQNDAAVINSTNHTVQVELVPGSSLSSLIATFTLSENATAKIGAVNQVSGTTSNDFSNDVTYTIVAEDGSEQDWIVSVNVEPYHGTDILTFSFAEQTGDATIDQTEHTIDIEVAEGTDVTNLVATFTLSDGATAKVDGNIQTSNTTENDFTNMVVYLVVAEDNTTQTEWDVTVTVEETSTGIEDLEKVEMVLYPNPATNYINVQSNVIANDMVELRIFNITGKVIATKEIYLSGELNTTFYFDRNMKSGIYLLQVKSSSIIATQRFIVK